MADHLFEDRALAALYDQMHAPDSRADFAFYLPMIMAAEAVLDVGCGTGALLHLARRAGHRGRLCGLDPAGGMLEQARKRADIEWVEGDLATAQWCDAFDLIIMTGHAFQALVEDFDIRRSLTAARAALTGDGRFAFDTRNPLVRDWETWTTDTIFEACDNGDRTRMTRRIEIPFDGRILRISHTFRNPAWQRDEVSHSTLRFLEAASLSALLMKTGLMVDAQFGDWDRAPLTETSPEIITIVRRDRTAILPSL